VASIAPRTPATSICRLSAQVRSIICPASIIRRTTLSRSAYLCRRAWARDRAAGFGRCDA
jgi:hypothetical protein